MFEEKHQIYSFPLFSGANVLALTHVRVVRFEQTINNIIGSTISEESADQTNIIRNITRDTRDRDQYCFAFDLKLETKLISRTAAQEKNELQITRHSAINGFQYCFADLFSNIEGGYQLEH